MKESIDIVEDIKNVLAKISSNAHTGLQHLATHNALQWALDKTIDIKQEIKQAQVDVLNKVKERAVGLAAIETYHICNLIDELIKEVKNEN